MREKKAYIGLCYKAAVVAFNLSFGVLEYNAQINLHKCVSSAISRPLNKKGESESRRSKEICVWDSKKSNVKQPDYQRGMD